MKWVVFNKTKVKLVVAESSGEGKRIAIALPIRGAGSLAPTTEEGVRFHKLGFRYQESSNAWYRKTAGLSVAKIISSFKDDACLQEVTSDNVYLRVPPKKIDVNQSKILSKKGKDHDYKKTAGKPSVGGSSDDRQRNLNTGGSNSNRKIGSDQYGLPSSSKSAGPARVVDTEVGKKDRESIGHNHKSDDGNRNTKDGNDRDNRVESYDKIERLESSDGSIFTTTSQRNSTLDSTTKSFPNYLPKKRGLDRPLVSAEERFSKNVEIVRVLSELKETSRTPSESEIEILTGFAGWGGLVDSLADDSSSIEVKKLLGREGYYQAMESSLTAYYTPESLSAAIWDLLEAKGYKGGRVLETSAGTGVFLNQRIAKLDDEQHFTAVEMDPLRRLFKNFCQITKAFKRLLAGSTKSYWLTNNFLEHHSESQICAIDFSSSGYLRVSFSTGC